MYTRLIGQCTRAKIQDKCGLMCTPLTQMFTCYTVKPKWHKCGLNLQMWINVGEYHKDI